MDFITKIFTVLILAVGLSACASAEKYLAATEARYENGNWYYMSRKNQENFSAKISKDENGNPVLDVKTTATTPEAAMAMAAQANAEFMKYIADILKSVEAQVKAAMGAAALAGGS